ncbi:MAG: dihydrolipoamide acetyltransferase family protein [Bacteroidales bacterium]|nr:2-oxo acid dehydrogenase subunit E2 [Bacteroidales bacterium]
MRHVFKFPDIGEGLEEGTIVEWYVKKGQEVESGQSLVQVETDKVTTDIPSPKTGTIVALYGSEGETINVGDPLAEIEIEGVEGEEAVKEEEKQPAGPSKEGVEEEEGAGVVGTIEVAGEGGHLPSSSEGIEHAEEAGEEKKPTKKALATPVARALAKDLGVDINNIKGSGPGGRVMKDDIYNYVEQQKKERPSAPQAGKETEEAVEYEDLTQIRKTIARNMSRSKQNAAHMTVMDEVEVSELVRIRNKYKEKYKDQDIKLNYLPFILKATARALEKHRQLNSELDQDNDRMLFKRYYNIGIAVDTEKGLVVPVIKHVDKLTVFELAQETNEIARKARDGELTMEDMKGGTFTVTSYGSIGGQFAMPVINYPQAGILGIGRIVKKPVVNENDEVVPGHMLPLSVSVDHRIVDGGEVSRFLNTLMNYLEDPVTLIME